MTDETTHSFQRRPWAVPLAGVRLGLSILAILLVQILFTPAAGADPGSNRLCNRALRIHRIAQSLQRERAQRIEWLVRLRSMATSLQNQPEGPARNFRLRAILAEARQVADRLKELDRKRAQLRIQATKLLTVMARSARNLDKQRRDKLHTCMGVLRALLPRPQSSSKHLTRVTVRPDDGPAELERKADLLADSADKLDRRLQRLRRALRRTERQVALRDAAGRALREDSLLTGQRRRSVATITQTARIHGTTTPNREGGGTTVGGADRQDLGNNYSTNGTAASSPPSVRHTNPAGLSQTWSNVLGAVRDLVGPEQADALAGQAESSNPAVRLAALRRAVELLENTRRRLRKKARRLRAQARRISGPRPGPRSRHPTGTPAGRSKSRFR